MAHEEYIHHGNNMHSYTKKHSSRTIQNYTETEFYANWVGVISFGSKNRLT